MNNDKVIVSNFQALTAKYGAAGLTKVKTALKALIAKDKAEGLTTHLIDLSDAKQMAKFNGKAVTVPSHQRQVKTAIDAVFKTIVPAYILILGSTDVVPHQDLDNPVADPEAGDPDPVVPSDLPYACEASYTKDPTKFVGPTRVVGRLPDLTGAKDPAYLLGVIEVAAKRESRPASEYATNFGISAHDWKQSTELTFQKLFGSTKCLQHSPAKGPKWSDGQLAAMSHFINCHGSIARPVFYGQQGESYPTAHSTKHFAEKIPNGAVAAVECCYGAQLYDPIDAQGVMSICNAYLAGGAYGYCGSTTTSYGPEDSNGQADLICLYFLQKIKAGASVGRAMLEARQQFAQNAAQLDPFDLKTLIQFNLLGDPSIHPVAKKSAHTPVSKSFAATENAAQRSINRTDRRRLLGRIGQQIQETQLVAVRAAKAAFSDSLGKKLRELAKKSGVNGDAHVMEFSIDPAAGKTAAAPRAKAAFAKLPKPEAYYVVSSRCCGADEKDISVKALVARVVDGEVQAFRKVVSR